MNDNQFLCKAVNVFSDDWISGYPLPDADIKNRWYLMFSYADGFDKFEVRPETICQYSGWKDKDGEKIFRGDKLKLINAEGKEIIVICEFGKIERNLVTLMGDITTCEISGFYFSRDGEENSKTFPIVKNYKGVHDTSIMKIIGNIYDTK